MLASSSPLKSSARLLGPSGWRRKPWGYQHDIAVSQHNFPTSYYMIHTRQISHIIPYPILLDLYHHFANVAIRCSLEPRRPRCGGPWAYCCCWHWPRPRAPLSWWRNQRSHWDTWDDGGLAVWHGLGIPWEDHRTKNMGRLLIRSSRHWNDME
jgi:hypothetical protein